MCVNRRLDYHKNHLLRELRLHIRVIPSRLPGAVSILFLQPGKERLELEWEHDGLVGIQTKPDLLMD